MPRQSDGSLLVPDYGCCSRSEERSTEGVWQKDLMSVLFVTPCYGGQVLEAHFRSCQNLKEELTRQGIKHDWLTGRNESLVHRARNEMTATFMKTDHERMMFIDADIEFTPDDVAKLWNLDADVAVGVYPMKKRDECWYAAWVDGKLIKNLGQFKGPIEVDFAGTGFMMIKRSALLQMAGRYGKAFIEDEAWESIKRLFSEAMHSMTDANLVRDKVVALLEDGFSPGVLYDGPHGEVPALFNTPIVGRHFDSEDYNFCRKWRAIGGKIVCDPSVRLIHWGQYAYGA